MGRKNGDPFQRTLTPEVIDKELRALGFLGGGEERMRCGMTGELLKSLVFIGPVSLQRLRHMVQDKVHARARGGRTTISRQPKDGRRFDGGLRCGVQERDCVLANGVSAFIRDRLMEQSDETKIFVCDYCGLPAIADKEGDRKECTICNTNSVSSVKIPYGTKLLFLELLSMNVAARIVVTPSGEGKIGLK